MNSKLVVRAILLSVILACFPSNVLSDEIGNAQVKGVLYGTKVHLKSASVDGGMLEIYEGDSWAFNSSLLIFLFDQKDNVAPGKTIRVDGKKQFSNPHVHCRFKNGKDVKCEIAMDGYKMTIKFEQPIRGYLPARFKLTIPGKKKTELTGKFFLDIKKNKLDT